MNSSHTHSHSLTDNHNHNLDFSEEMSREEVLALLAYMIEHNRHHEEELHELSHNINSEAGNLIHEALNYYRSGNDILNKALSILQNE